MVNTDEHTKWLKYIPSGDAIERAQTERTTVSLLASKNGTEMIHHSLTKGTSWGLTPQPEWNELEAIFVISGELHYQVGDTNGILKVGDTLSAEPVTSHVIFTAIEASSFLYVSSSPVFHHYSEFTRSIHQLAIEIEEKDGYTARHCERIRHHSLLIGKKMGLSSSELFSLSYGAFFHDVGKINIPNEILLKPGKLSSEEFDIIKLHTIYGKEILISSSIPYFASGSVIAEQHHERFDGSGYPYALKGDEIFIGAAIVAVVDSFDAMTSKRPYQPAKSREDAVSEICSLRGILYNPFVVDAFMEVIDQFID